jgi:hypothetical protein
MKDDRPKWAHFEAFVTAIHHHLEPTGTTVEADVQLREPHGASHQIDVLIGRDRPAGPTLVSCKAWSQKVGVDHVREWSDIVRHTGAAAGVIVGESGFTSAAKAAARNPARNISLWLPRALTLDDFAPDAESPDGYIAGVEVNGTIFEPRLAASTFRLEASRADGPPEGKNLQYELSFATRGQWDLLDASGLVIGNLWDEFLKATQPQDTPGPRSYVPSRKTYVIVQDIRLELHGMYFELEVDEHRLSTTVDLLKEAFSYENVLDGTQRIVPYPALRWSRWRPSSPGA